MEKTLQECDNKWSEPELPLEALVAGKFVAKILLRFTFKRIGISTTQEQQQMPDYAHARVCEKNRNAWSWGGITTAKRKAAYKYQPFEPL